MTRQRRIILEELRKVCTHPTAEEIHALVRIRLPNISLGTVYRNLDFLASTGEILQLNSGGSLRRFDGKTSPHCHVRCLSCGRVGDVDVCNCTLPNMETLNPLASDFIITGSHLEFEGYCRHCKSAA